MDASRKRSLGYIEVTYFSLEMTVDQQAPGLVILYTTTPPLSTQLPSPRVSRIKQPPTKYTGGGNSGDDCNCAQQV